MTTTTPSGAAEVTKPADVTVVIDDIEVAVPKGTLVIRAAEQIGIQIPRFCDHPLLKPAGACRQCLVDVAVPDREGTVRPMPKPQASCTLEATPGMVVRTQRTSPVADKAQKGVMELLLINHPLDCPICDKGGECPLQNQAMSNGRSTSRFVDVKRTFPKPISISTEILLDRERCVLCQRCTRFSKEIAGDAFIDLQKRGASQQIGRFDEGVLGFTSPCGDDAPSPTQVPIGSVEATAAQLPVGDGPIGVALSDESGRPFASYFSGNTIQICPVGALTGAAYRFRARPFDLVSTPSIAEHDANGSAIRIDHRRGVVLRRLAGDDPAVNEEWITDKDRFAFGWQAAGDRLTSPMVRDRAEDGSRGELRPASWAEALEVAADALTRAKSVGGVGVLPGGRLTVEDAYAYAKFARVVLGTNDIDHRARVASAEEADFLGHAVAGTGLGVTFTDLEAAPAALLVGLEAEEEAGVTFLRLRKSAIAGGVKVFSIAPYATRGLERMHGTLLPAAPGTEVDWLDGVAEGGAESADLAAAAEALRQPGAVILVGERLAGTSGGYSAVLRVAAATGARIAWIPRRVGERGGVEVGTLPGLLPGGRPVADAAGRAATATIWGADDVPEAPGRDGDAILSALAAGELTGVVVGGVELADLPDPDAALAALQAADVVVSLEVRRSAVTELADVVLPVAPPVEKSGSFWNWEGRLRPFGPALESTAMADHRVLHMIADAAGIDLGTPTPDAARAELERFGAWTGTRVTAPAVEGIEPAPIQPGTAVLASWRLLLDAGRGQDGELFLAGTAKRPVARMSPATAGLLPAADGRTGAPRDGDLVTVSTPKGAITLPVVITDMVDHVVWVPMNSLGSQVHAALGAVPGDVVTISTDGGQQQ